MNDTRNSRFKSYIEDLELETVSLSNEQRTKLLDGEVVICEAHNVIMYAPLTERKKSSTGILTVTNFKLSFASGNEDDEYIGYQQNLLLGLNEICLSSIDAIYQVGERSKKKLLPGHNISTKVKELQLVCKNMRVLHFSFKFSDKDSGKSVTNAVLHHSTPKRQSLLFAYDYKEPYYKPILKEVQMFRMAEDWRKELDRTRCKNWRVCSANENFNMSLNLPQTLIVPQSTTDSMIQNAATHFKSRFGPIWVWGTSKGAALVRMADLEVTITDRTQENVMLEHIRKSHYKKTPPEVMDLTKDCPSHKEIQWSYLKLRELCCADSVRLFKTQDSKFYSLLENSKWLQCVSMCLLKAVDASFRLNNELTVVLQEVNGRDMNCVISSLTQLLLDPHWRTMRGFQSLIQKEWVVLGHPFRNRLGVIDDDDSEPAPYFLLFLDCVWQLLQQYPTAFQVSEIYLTTLWDSTHITIFDTFIFNCEHDRDLAQKTNKLINFRSVWDWSEQFSERDRKYFCNPLYDDSYNEQIIPNTTVPFLEIWSQCYFRWCPALEIRNGGKPQIDLSCRIIAADICMINQVMTHGVFSASVNRTKEEMLQMLQKVNSFFPFSHHNGHMQGILSDNHDLLSVDGIDTQSILNLPND